MMADIANFSRRSTTFAEAKNACEAMLVHLTK
jgi:hypothetical protein